jgi:hypothetical protein
MTIKEIESNLPNGFHDANLKTISIDYVTRKAELDITVDISNAEAPEEDATEDYRDGKLILSGLLFCIIEPPDLRSADLNADGLWITSSGTVKPGEMLKDLPLLLPEGAFVHYFFVNNWNASIYLAAMDARFE